MTDTCKRITFMVTPEMEVMLDKTKKDFFYRQTKSDMIRELVLAGIRALDEEKASKNPEIFSKISGGCLLLPADIPESGPRFSGQTRC